ncbi:hypothetical protein EVAR_94269_1 [Eumeta japonica]|uniref:Uncharacterized protein n=1 Tax=Eumeta variegata TaxID=151549 RepID=A0A4C1UEV3_EUMVA|nr:hypothetical protein EVAR_94269_1 [Eumeta japonica]
MPAARAPGAPANAISLIENYFRPPPPKIGPRPGRHTKNFTIFPRLGFKSFLAAGSPPAARAQRHGYTTAVSVGITGCLAMSFALSIIYPSPLPLWDTAPPQSLSVVGGPRITKLG